MIEIHHLKYVFMIFNIFRSCNDLVYNELHIIYNNYPPLLIYISYYKVGGNESNLCVTLSIQGIYDSEKYYAVLLSKNASIIFLIRSDALFLFLLFNCFSKQDFDTPFSICETIKSSSLINFAPGRYSLRIDII